MTELVEPEFPGLGLNPRRARRPAPSERSCIDWSSHQVAPSYCRPCKRRFVSQQTLLQHQRDSNKHADSDEAAAAKLKLEAYARHKDLGHAFCCVCWLSFETGAGLLQHLIDSADHADSSLQRQASKLFARQQESKKRANSGSGRQVGSIQPDMQWLLEAQISMEQVNSSLRDIAEKMAAQGLGIPHTQFDAAVHSIRPLHQLLQLLADVPPEKLAHHASQLHAADNPLRLVHMHVGLRSPAGALPQGLIGKRKKCKKQSAMQKLKALQWYSRECLKDIGALCHSQLASYPRADLSLDAAATQARSIHEFLPMR